MLACILWYNPYINPYRPTVPSVKEGEVDCGVRYASRTDVSISCLVLNLADSFSSPITFLMLRLALLIVHYDADPVWWTIFLDNPSVAEYCSAIIIASLIHIEPYHYRKPTAVHYLRKEQETPALPLQSSIRQAGHPAVIVTRPEPWGRSPLADTAVPMGQTTGVENV